MPRFNNHYASLSPAVWLGLALLCAGCSSSDWKSDTNSVTGKVTVNGQPAEGVFVKLIAIGGPVDKRNSDCWALTKEDGTFKMSTYGVGDGAPAGEYAVICRWPDNPAQLVPDKLKEKYWDVEDPLMTVTVEGATEIPPIELQN